LGKEKTEVGIRERKEQEPKLNSVIYIRVIYSSGIPYTVVTSCGYSDEEIPDDHSHEDAFNATSAKRDLPTVCLPPYWKKNSWLCILFVKKLSSSA
jgi:hypothetical protein